MTTVQPPAQTPLPAAPDLRRQVARLLVIRGSGHLGDGQRRYPRWELENATIRRLLAEGVGGVILLGGSAAELRLRCEQLRSWSQQPLLICADVEEGVGQRFEGATWLAPPLAVGRLHRSDPQRAIALARRYGHCTGRQARLLGLNGVLAPVCDVNNNPLNPVINVRAWGETTSSAAVLATAFLEGAQAEGVLCCAKHFPGHGDTSDDSHLELPQLPHGRERLEAIELPPFRAAIAAGCAAVMTAHLQLDALDPLRPATLSRPVLTGLLRQELGFTGLVITDALVMEAIASRWGAAEAAVLAFEAGSDLILMPADADAAIDGLVEAFSSGRLQLEQLHQSLRRREQALAVAGSRAPAASLAPLEELSALEKPQDQALARELVEMSLDSRGPQGLPAGPGVNLIRLDNSLNCAFLPAMAPALLRPAAAGYQCCLLDARGPSPWSGNADAPLALERLPDGPLFLQLFVRGNPFRGSAGGDEPWPAVIRQLLRVGRLAGLTVLGSPYLWEALEPLLPGTIPSGYSPAQMPLAQATLLSRLGLAAGSIAEGGFTD
ncbi:glycoside hydrolase family 3 N-terminal domain-containing protein [Synechococcus sp. RedBA-s]|uniref:glycoside hydrolase family 3 N-terminal domain-containing protein n=1 Tax=Synechococcus sp. RedBA-s TaxID=2823741 RepID=UPI0020CC93C5|nr:glycoside hydrolase family 3 N-terminal domain-containing protein [Synechococcus sp. RedBA-s]MCP9801589.1 glycosyl hydrolase family 3 [Synechococcus sp. RedBA-s]